MKSGGGEVEEGGSGEGQCGEGWVGGELAPIGMFLSVDFECMTFHFLSEKWILPIFSTLSNQHGRRSPFLIVVLTCTEEI